MSAAKLFSLEGKVALVTGANSGIGLAIAEALASAGGKVVLVARRASELEAAAKRIGPQAAALAGDLADRRALFDCAAKARTRRSDSAFDQA